MDANNAWFVTRAIRTTYNMKADEDFFDSVHNGDFRKTKQSQVHCGVFSILFF